MSKKSSILPLKTVISKGKSYRQSVGSARGRGWYPDHSKSRVFASPQRPPSMAPLGPVYCLSTVCILVEYWGE